MSDTTVTDDKRKRSRRRIRWVIYPSLVVIVIFLFGVCALFYLGTFSHLRIPPAATRALQARGLSVGSDPSLTVYANPQTYAVYWGALRSGNLQQRLQLEQSGRVIALPQGTLIWYQPKPERGRLTPVHLIGSRYIGRTYWVTNSDFS